MVKQKTALCLFPDQSETFSMAGYNLKKTAATKLENKLKKILLISQTVSNSWAITSELLTCRNPMPENNSKVFFG